MQVGLFIPCYIDQLYPEVGLATVKLLQRYGCQIEFPREQTCCGQPMANTGVTESTRPLAHQFQQIFQRFEYIVCPSGSCVSMVRHHYDEYLGHEEGFPELKAKTFELCEFLVDVLGVQQVEGHFPHRVGLHQSCHGLRELGLGLCSEIVGPRFFKVRQLLEGLDGITLTPLQREDECCGFGGTFAVAEEAVSCLMGKDRIADHEQGGAEIIAGNDMSCLMHMSGLLKRNKSPIKVMHVAQILAG